MKTRLLLFALLAFCITACNNTNETEPKPKTWQDEVVGSWKLTSLHGMDRDLTDMTSGVLPCVMETRIHFKADNSYDFTTTCTAIIENRQGTYQCAEPVIVLDNDGDKMIFNYSNGQIKTTMSFNVSDLGLPLPIPSIDMECTFTKE